MAGHEYRCPDPIGGPSLSMDDIQAALSSVLPPRAERSAPCQATTGDHVDPRVFRRLIPGMDLITQVVCAGRFRIRPSRPRLRLAAATAATTRGEGSGAK